MVKIQVLVFAQLRDSFESGRFVVDVAPGETAGALAARLVAESGTSASLPISLAVNESFVESGHRLADGDTLALIPPVSGG
jgi:molybdopterin converting factor small subunit